VILFIIPIEIEGRYIHIDDIGIKRIISGCGKKSLNIEKELLEYKAAIDIVIVFGCCGLIKRDMPLGKLYIPQKWSYQGETIEIMRSVLENMPYSQIIMNGVTVDEAVHTTAKRDRLHREGFQIVDQESFHLVKLCQKYNVPVCVIRYGIDYCDRKMIPIPGVNHFYHKWNHWSMQKKMSKILKSLSDKRYGWIDDEY